MDKLYHCIILSTKSAGSSALQMFLHMNYGFSMTKKTRHNENETLFWTKAASVLELEQLKMHRSKVPYSNAEALEALQAFCRDNGIEALKPGMLTKANIFDTYYKLILQNQPRFVEKSPHHLYNQSNLDLIAEFIDLHQDKIDFKVIGLVRHPLSVLYSGWERWKYDCSEFERDWFISNQNLLKNREKLNIEIVRYEDLVAQNGALIQHMPGLAPVSNKFRFRKSSLEKWKSDKAFGHVLSHETKALANKFGYSDFETSEEQLTWKMKSWSSYAGMGIKRLLRAFVL